MGSSPKSDSTMSTPFNVVVVIVIVIVVVGVV
jgi:hypothetical protein